MQYISGIIEDDYKDWKEGTGVLIASQTGTGKTTFILEKLLTHAATENKFVVYICNRKSLNNQMKNSVIKNLFSNNSDIPSGVRKRLIITTYQECEKQGDFPIIRDEFENSHDTPQEKYIAKYVSAENVYDVYPNTVKYYVFDEAHYFVADALFNENTNKWSPRKLIGEKFISVFLTATPEPLAIYLDIAMKKEGWNPKVYLDTMFYWQQYRKYVSLVIKNNGCKPYEELNKYSQYIPLYGYFHKESISFPLECLYRKPKNVKVTLPIPFLFGLRKLHYFKPEIIEEEQRRALAQRFTVAHEVVDRFINNGLYSGSTNFFANDQIYLNQSDYSYLDIWYFADYCELNNEVLDSKDKWVFFVDNIKEGGKLETSFQNKNVVFLTAESRAKEGSKAQKAFEEIEEMQSFSCDVLITTRVLDCGVSLTDTKIKNIVIDEKDITEFIQMIGRRRCQGSDDKVRCFIKHTGNGEWHKNIAMLERELDFISDLYNMQFPDVNHPEQNVDVVSVLMELKSNKHSNLVIIDLDYERSSAKVVKEFSINLTAFVNRIYNHTVLCHAREQENQKPYPYLEMQLTRLGHTYDLNRWYKYEKSVQALKGILDKSMEKGDMGGTDKVDFINNCLQEISYIQKLHLPQNMIKVIKEYEKWKSDPSHFIKVPVQSLNDTFEALELPYKIKGIQKKKNNRETQWRVTFNDVNTDRKKTEDMKYNLGVLENGLLVNMYNDWSIRVIRDQEYIDMANKAKENGVALDEYVKKKYSIDNYRDLFTEVDCKINMDDCKNPFARKILEEQANKS